MFGYVTINKGELKVKDYERYQAYYCGLCRALKENFGIFGQVTLTYDMTFIHLLLSGLYEPDEEKVMEHCIIHPMSRHTKITCKDSGISQYCADMNMLLAYYKLLDDWNDDKSVKANAMATLIRKNCLEAARRHPDKAKAIKRYMVEQRACEEAGVTDLDKVSACTGRMLGELMAYKDDEWKDYLYKIGFYLGKFIYLMDAYDDLEEDIKNNSYNPFINISGDDNFKENVRDMLAMMAADATREFEKLPIFRNVDILRNILYSGIWVKFNGREEQDGIRSIQGSGCHTKCFGR